MSDSRRTMGLVPGCNYMGPGNPLPNGVPTCHADKIAEEHDFAYLNARHERDVQKADERAILGFAADALANTSALGAIGAVGIGVKYAAEKALGRVIKGQWGLHSHGTGSAQP